jgi:hypothetical protein
MRVSAKPSAKIKTVNRCRSLYHEILLAKLQLMLKTQIPTLRSYGHEYWIRNRFGTPYVSAHINLARKKVET